MPSSRPADAPSVLFINRVFPPQRGATGRLLRELAEALVAGGWRVTIVCDGPLDAVPPPDAADGFRVLRTGQGGGAPGAIGYLLALLRLTWGALRAGRHDLVVTMTDPPLLGLAGPLIGAVTGARKVHWCHDLYPELFPVLGVSLPGPVLRCLRALSTWSLSRYDRIIALDPAMAERLRTRGLAPSKLTILPNWGQAELELAKPAEAPPWPDGTLAVLYAGTFGRAHPVGLLIEAAERLQRTHPQIRFVVAGEGRNRPALDTEVADRALGNVILLPYQEPAALAALCRAAPIHLALADSGALGLSVPCKAAQAAAARRPLLLARTCGTGTPPSLPHPAAVMAVAGGAALAIALARLAERPDELATATADAARRGGAWTPSDAAENFARVLVQALDRAEDAGYVAEVRTEARHG